MGSALPNHGFFRCLGWTPSLWGKPVGLIMMLMKSPEFYVP